MSRSRAKGRKGEHEVAHLLGGKRAPLSGIIPGTGDIIIDQDSLWKDWVIEVKRRAKIGAVSLEAALQQAKAARVVGDMRRPLVLAREDNGPWRIYVDAKDLIGWIEALTESGQESRLKALLRQIENMVREARGLV